MNAIDELERLRAEVIAAKADAARLREAAQRAKAALPSGLPGSTYGNAHKDLAAALSATDSGAWLRAFAVETARAALLSVGYGRSPEAIADDALRGAP